MSLEFVRRVDENRSSQGFRNFATKVAKLLRLGIKNKRVCFVLLSFFRNFGLNAELTWHSAKKEMNFFCSALVFS